METYQLRQRSLFFSDVMLRGRYPSYIDRKWEELGVQVQMEPGDSELIAQNTNDYLAFSYYMTSTHIAGMKIRVPESSLYVDTFKMMGAAPTPLPMGEVYTAIDTGVVSGLENTPDTCLNNSFFEVAKYFNMTNHLNAPTTFSMSAKIFDSLNEDEQNLLLEAGLRASRYGLESTKTSDAAYREQLKEKGMEFIETDVESMRAKIDYTSYPFMQSEEAKTLFDLVQKSK